MLPTFLDQIVKSPGESWSSHLIDLSGYPIYSRRLAALSIFDGLSTSSIEGGSLMLVYSGYVGRSLRMFWSTIASTLSSPSKYFFHLSIILEGFVICLVPSAAVRVSLILAYGP